MGVMELVSYAAGVIFVLGFIPYIRAILAGSTKPAKASWLIWASLDTITLTAMILEKSVNGQIVGAVLGVWVIVALALRYGRSGWNTLDVICLAGALVGIGLLLFASAVLGMVVSLSVVFIGAVPTFVSAYHKPEDEDRTAWTIFWVSCVLAVIAVPEWTLEHAAQPVTFLAVESTMMYLVWLRPRFVRMRQQSQA